MRWWLLLLAACATEPVEHWSGRWSDGFHPMRIEACGALLAIDWDDRVLLGYVDGDLAKPCIACAEPWPGSLVLDGDVIHADIDGFAYDAPRVGDDDGDRSECPRRY